MYTIDDEIAVDHVARFENLPDELSYIAERIGLPEPITMAQAKTQWRPDRSDNVVDDKVIAKVREVCAREIETFGYAPRVTP